MSLLLNGKVFLVAKNAGRANILFNAPFTTRKCHDRDLSTLFAIHINHIYKAAWPLKQKREICSRQLLQILPYRLLGVAVVHLIDGKLGRLFLCEKYSEKVIKMAA